MTTNLHSNRMQTIQSPLIPVIGELISNNPGTISLGQGIVYYNPPTEALDRVSEFWQQAHSHKYKSVQGITPLLEAIEVKLQQDNNYQLHPDSCVVVTAGSNMAFMNTVLAITQPEDEIILQTPYYFQPRNGD